MSTNEPTEQRDWSVFNMLGLLKRMLRAKGTMRLSWGPACEWCPSGRDVENMKALLAAGLVRESRITADGATYYYPTAEAFEIFGMPLSNGIQLREKPPKKGGDT